MQPLALHLVNSIFLGDYLTSEGQASQTDLDMIADAGFEVEGAGTTTLPRHRADALGGGCGTQDATAGAGCGSHDDAGAAGCGSHGGGGGCGPCGGHGEQEQPLVGGVADAGESVPASRTDAAGAARTDLVAVRRRGAGTDLAPNA